MILLSTVGILGGSGSNPISDGVIQVRLKPCKCFFGMTDIDFLGHIFDVSRLQLSRTRVQGIKELPEPICIGVPCFIGMVN